MPVRVMVEDVWDDVHLELAGTAVLGDVKLQALRRAGVTRDADEYLVKFRGAELDDEDRTLSDLGVGPNSSLIVLSRRRRPVR
jgi:hypothetical protein